MLIIYSIQTISAMHSHDFQYRCSLSLINLQLNFPTLSSGILVLCRILHHFLTENGLGFIDNNPNFPVPV